MGQLVQPGAVRPADHAAVGAARSTPRTGRRATQPGTTFQPTFLYESLWNLALCGFLLWIDKRVNRAAGRLFAVYVVGYGVVRFWVERLRIDSANHIGGLRVNEWVALGGLRAAVGS